LNSLLAHGTGHPQCTNSFLLASPFHFSRGTLGLYKERRCWWNWSGNCAKCSAPVRKMEGIFCANFCEPCGSWPACRKTWHARCYECLGQDKFPVKRIQDEEGSCWYKHERRVHRINHRVRGAHASIQFQCENCWMVNLEGRLPVEGLDDAYVMLIHRANLDAMGGCAVATIEGHAASTMRSVYNCQLFRKTPTIPPRGPMALTDTVGMGLAVELLFHLLNAVPRIKGESHIQFNSMRRPRATFTSAWESSPIGIQEGSTFTSNTARVTLTSCPSQQKWFGRMMRGAESRMVYTS
jgi:hypothetical protein